MSFHSIITPQGANSSLPPTQSEAVRRACARLEAQADQYPHESPAWVLCKNAVLLALGVPDTAEDIVAVLDEVATSVRELAPPGASGPHARSFSFSEAMADDEGGAV